MYTTIIHPLRKAYLLSINEYCVLEAIRTLSNNQKYGGWCIMSMGRLAKALDLSVDTVMRCYKKLEQIELIERRKQTRQDTAVRSVDEWNEWFMTDKADILLSLKNSHNDLTTLQVRGVNRVGGGNLPEVPVAKSSRTGGNLPDNINNNINNNIIFNSHSSLNTTTVVDDELEKKLIKWVKGFKNINNPIGFAKHILKSSAPAAIRRAMKNPLCTSPSQLVSLIEHYTKKHQP